MLWVRVEGNHLPLDRIKHQLVEEGVVGSDESLNVFFWDDDVHLQVLTQLPDHLKGTRAHNQMSATAPGYMV